MRLHSRTRPLSVSILALALLSACGGGDDSDAGTPGVVPPEGAYAGTLTGSTSSAFRLLFLGTEVWALYGDTSGSVFLANGFIQGTGTTSNGVFGSVNARDFGPVPAEAGTATATYTSAGVFNGMFRTASTTTGFSGSPIPASLYNYNTPASLPTIVGAWNLSGVAVNISGSGGITGSVTGPGGTCTFSGGVVPRATRNVFDVSIEFADVAACAFRDQTMSGIAITYSVGNLQNQLLVGVYNGTRDGGTALAGVR